MSSHSCETLRELLHDPRAYFSEGRFSLFVRARAHLRAAQVTRKSCAVGMRNHLSGRILLFRASAIDHSTVVCSATWPLNGSEAGGDLVLIKTLLFLL